jgi:hypothetical protein
VAQSGKLFWQRACIGVTLPSISRLKSKFPQSGTPRFLGLWIAQQAAREQRSHPALRGIEPLSMQRKHCLPYLFADLNEVLLLALVPMLFEPLRNHCTFCGEMIHQLAGIIAQLLGKVSDSQPFCLPIKDDLEGRLTLLSIDSTVLTARERRMTIRSLLNDLLQMIELPMHHLHRGDLADITELENRFECRPVGGAASPTTENASGHTGDSRDLCVPPLLFKKACKLSEEWFPRENADDLADLMQFFQDLHDPCLPSQRWLSVD